MGLDNKEKRIRSRTPCYNVIEVEDGRVGVFHKYPFKRRELAVHWDSTTQQYFRHEERIDAEITGHMQ